MRRYAESYTGGETVFPLDANGLSEIIRSIGTDGLGQRLDQTISGRVQFDMSCIFLFSFNNTPLFLHDGYCSSVPRKTLETYLRGGYLLDPFYVASINEHTSGVWRMGDLAPDSFFTSEFVIAKDIHPCVSSEAGALVEEIGIIVPLRHRTAAVYSLMRNHGSVPFTRSELDNLRQIEPVIAASISTHCRNNASYINHEYTKEDIEETFLGAFHGQLTPAQQSITKLILRGHSNISISRHMNISEGTAKIHRHNIYKRLSISSQSELFQLFITHLTKTER